MRSYLIYLNYDPQQLIGRIQVEDDVPLKVLASGALIPALSRRNGEVEWGVENFGLVPRTQVDTRPDPALGEA